jgi:NAD(P) transhydrogenase
MSEVPHSLVVVGGGVIGCEYACTFAALGIPVTLVEARTPLLSFLDLEMSTRLKARMEGLGVQFRMPATVESVDVEEGRVTVGLNGGDSIAAAALLVASGRSANTAGMGLEEAGVKLGERGRVLVNEHYQTSVPNIYAAGDCVGFPALASTSMEQARVAMAHGFNLYPKDRLAPILPYGLYTIPELSMAGETEESCKLAGWTTWWGGPPTRPTPAGRSSATGRLPEAHLPARGHEAPRGARHRRAGVGAGPHRAHRAALRRRGAAVHRHLLQLPDALRALQVRDVQRHGPANPL